MGTRWWENACCKHAAATVPSTPVLRPVTQEDYNGCSVSALAMLLTCTYEHAKKLIVEHTCDFDRCSKCRDGINRDDPQRNYMACAGHLASILRAQGYKTRRTYNLQAQNVYPVLVKLNWGPGAYYGRHFVIWDAAKQKFVDSAGDRPHNIPLIQCFRWADEPAYIVQHPRFLTP